MMYGFDNVFQWKCGARVRLRVQASSRQLHAVGRASLPDILLAAAFTLSLMVLLTACGGGAGHGVGGPPAARELHPAGGAPTASQPSPALMTMLRAELMRVLAERGVEGSRAGAPVPPNTGGAPVPPSIGGAPMPLARTASAPPSGAGAAAVLSYSEDSAALTWGYYCPGDYNQDGQVGVADLTPLGMHYGEISPDGLGHPFPPNSIGAVVDGNGDGLIGIADVSPIGANFGARVEGYRVYQAPDAGAVPVEPDAPNGGGSALIATVPFKAAGGPALRTIYTAQVVPTETAQWYWVRPYQGAVDGAASNGVTVALPPNEPPTPVLIATGVTETPAHIVWDATGSTDEDGDVVRYAWDFDDDGVYEYESPADEHALPFPLDVGADGTMDYYYYAPGVYWVGVKVTDDDGASSTTRTSVTIAEVAKWQVVTVDQLDGDTSRELLANPVLLDAEGAPAIFYSRKLDEPDPKTGSEMGAAYTRALDPGGAQWPAPEIVYGSYVADAAIIAGRPALISSYRKYEVPGSDMVPFTERYKFIRARDASGTAWADPVEYNQCYFPSLAEPEGVPLIFERLLEVAGIPVVLSMRYASTDGDYLPAGYCRAKYPGGTSWESAIFTMYSGLADDWAVAGGLPAAIEVAGNDVLLYRATDESAAQWSGPILVDSLEEVVGTVWLLEAAGNPAVAYFDTDTDSLRFRRALKADGSTWGGPVVLADRAHGGGLAGLVDGRPAAFYEDRVDGLVKFIAANDDAGTYWNQPVAVPADPSIFDLIGPPKRCDMGGAGGLPGVVYITQHVDLPNALHQELKFIGMF